MFKPVDSIPNFVEIEKRLLKWWYQSGLVKKYLHKNDQSAKRFSFLDGPITANNPMGVHHAWGRTLKDLYQRYHNMKGEKQRFQNGFDCQGLWVEVEVEKELGFKDKKDIEKYGIAQFVDKCKERVRKYSKIQTDQSQKLGYFMDWQNSYYTMSDENNYMIWYFLKKCWQDGNLYKGRDSVPWCPRCGTAISQHEILQEEYQALTHKSVVLKFPTKKNEYLLAWTTTPWSIPGTIALMVHPDFDYLKVKQKDGEFILAKGRISSLKGPYKIIEEFKGKQLIGRTFTHPHQDFPPLRDQKFAVIPSEEFVTLDVGTGIVTNNPGVGHEDYLAAKKVNLKPLESIDEAANFLPGYSWLSGRNAKDKQVTDEILRDLKERGFVYDVYNFSHRYPVCWRCKTELVFRMVDEWYIAMDDKEKKGAKNYREQLKKIVTKIKWMPAWGLKRELDWLKNMEDWLISKKRYWGLALPIWECQCGRLEVIGSKEELKEKAVKGWHEFEGHSPHRPWIDKVKIECPACGELANRISDVGNPWLDAGIVAYSTYIDPKTGRVSYQQDKKYWQKWFPADLVLECLPGQFKNWFYSLIAMSTVLENKPPFKTLVGHASVRDEKGEEMHKSRGNAIDFNEAARKIGIDVMRWFYVKQNHQLNLNFGYHVADQVRRQFHLTLWNVYKFFVVYANLAGCKPASMSPVTCHLSPVLDKWILSRLNNLIKEVTNRLENYDNPKAAEAIENFLINDLSLWYIRRSRDRVNPSSEDKGAQQACLDTLYSVLKIFSLLLAPFNPFLAEEIYQNLTKEESIHLSNWPEFNQSLIDKKLEEEMEQVRKICELGHSARKSSGIRVRQPLRKLKVNPPACPSGRRAGGQKLKVDEELIGLIKDELNVKNVQFVKSRGELMIELDTKLTPKLKTEGEARELIRQIQELRKKASCQLNDKIIVFAPSWPKQFESQIKAKTLAEKIVKRGKLGIKKVTS